MAEIANRDVLADMKVKIAAPRGQDERASNGGRPDDLIFNEPLNVFQDGYPWSLVSASAV